jgi:hypothetical protein
MPVPLINSVFSPALTNKYLQAALSDFLPILSPFKTILPWIMTANRVGRQPLSRTIDTGDVAIVRGGRINSGPDHFFSNDNISPLDSFGLELVSPLSPPL